MTLIAMDLNLPFLPGKNPFDIHCYFEPDKAEVDTQTRLHGGETPRRIRRRAEAVERHRRSEPRAALEGDGAQRAGD